MEQKSSKRIAKVILGQSIGSARLVIALFTICATIMKLLYDKYLPNIIDFDAVRWSIIALGCLFFIFTFYRNKTAIVVSYFAFFLYLLTIVYVVSFTLVNHFDPNTVIILILIIGASTIIINNLSYYGIQSGIIILASIVVFYDNALSNENAVAFFNLLIAIGVFAIVVSVRLKLITSVKHSHANLERLQVLSVVADKKGEIVFVSPSVLKLLGYEPEELLSNGWWRTRGLSEGWIAREHILNYPNVIPKEIISIEGNVVAKDGETVWLSWSNSVLSNGNYMGIALDVTKYKEKQAVLN